MLKIGSHSDVLNVIIGVFMQQTNVVIKYFDVQGC